MTNAIILLATATLASAAAVLKGDDLTSFLEGRNTYAEGVNIYARDGCAGTEVAVRNHDSSSCQAASINQSPNLWISIKDKTDGADGGRGCMTIFEDTGCSSDARVYALNGDGQCYTLPFYPGCVVVAQSPEGSCAINAPTCSSDHNSVYT